MESTRIQWNVGPNSKGMQEAHSRTPHPAPKSLDSFEEVYKSMNAGETLQVRGRIIPSSLGKSRAKSGNGEV